LSFYFLAASEGDTGDGAEYAVSRDFAFSWSIFDAVAAEFTYLWDIYSGLQATFTYKWNIQGYLSKAWTYKWNIGYYISREFTYLWTLYGTAASVGGKIKHSFKTNAVVNRFYRTFRNG